MLLATEYFVVYTIVHHMLEDDSLKYFWLLGLSMIPDDNYWAFCVIPLCIKHICWLFSSHQGVYQSPVNDAIANSKPLSGHMVAFNPDLRFYLGLAWTWSLRYPPGWIQCRKESFVLAGSPLKCGRESSTWPITELIWYLSFIIVACVQFPVVFKCMLRPCEMLSVIEEWPIL